MVATVNGEIFVYENIHVLNVCVNKIFTKYLNTKILSSWNYCECIAAIIIIKSSIINSCYYVSLYFGTETTKCSSTCAVSMVPIAIGDKHVHIKSISKW